jgi:hypothetical protein
MPFGLVFALFFLAIVTFQQGFAQGQGTQTQPAQTPTPERVSVTIISVKPEMVTEFENFIKSETNPPLIKAGAKWREVWRTGTFGDVFEYVVVAPIDSFAQYDGPSPLEKALGKDGLEAWRTKRGRLVNSVRTMVLVSKPELTYEGKMAGPPKYAVVNFVHVAPGRTTEYENFIKNELLPVMKRADVPGYWVNQTLMGGDPNQYVTLTLHDSYADLEKGLPSVRVLGAEGSVKLYQKLPAGVVMHVERVFSKYVPELSFRQAAPATAKQ